MKLKYSTLLFIALAALSKALEQEEKFIVRGDNICIDGEDGEYCYPKVFKPLDVWQDVLPGQQLPGGKLFSCLFLIDFMNLTFIK